MSEFSQPPNENPLPHNNDKTPLAPTPPSVPQTMVPDPPDLPGGHKNELELPPPDATESPLKPKATKSTQKVYPCNIQLIRDNQTLRQHKK